MKQFTILLILVLAVGCGSEESSHPEKISKFISEPGEYAYSQHGGKVRIYQDGDKLNFRISHPKSGGSIGPTDPQITPGSDWFIFIETQEKAWVYDGNKTLHLYYADNGKNAVYQLSKGWNTLPAKPPVEVTNRLPEEMKPLLATDK